MGTPIKTYVCRVKCFFRNRVWTVGESLQAAPGERIPKHFIDRASYKPDPKNIPPSDPKSFAEWQKKEQQEALRAVGHGKPQDVIPGMPSTEAPKQNAESAAASQTEADPFQ